MQTTASKQWANRFGCPIMCRLVTTWIVIQSETQRRWRRAASTRFHFPYPPPPLSLLPSPSAFLSLLSVCVYVCVFVCVCVCMCGWVGVGGCRSSPVCFPPLISRTWLSNQSISCLNTGHYPVKLAQIGQLMAASHFQRRCQELPILCRDMI